MISILQWIDQAISFPQMSFLRPVFAVAVLLLVVDLSFGFVFSMFGKFFGR